MNNEPSSTDVLFGKAVLDWRQARGVSQRALAEILTADGMTADASAVSRIEKGTRSVRLTEALTIARALDVDLDDLVAETRAPSDNFERMRRAANSDLTELQEISLAVAQDLAELVGFVDEHPEVLARLSDDRFPTPTDGRSYLAWIAARWRANAEQSGPEMVLAEDQDASGIRDVLSAVSEWIVRRIDEVD